MKKVFLVFLFLTALCLVSEAQNQLILQSKEINYDHITDSTDAVFEIITPPRASDTP